MDHDAGYRILDVGESDLWARVIAQDDRAFTALFDLHRDRIFRHALRLVGSRHDAEDVTAASFFELWRRRNAVRLVNDSILPWLLVTATNISRNLRRSIQRYDAMLAALPRTRDSGNLPDPAHQVEQLENQERLLEALRKLSPIDSALLVLTALEGFSVTEAARALCLTDGAARTRLHRARARLKSTLGPHALISVQLKTMEGTS